jgi:hypothetical protein
LSFVLGLAVGLLTHADWPTHPEVYFSIAAVFIGVMRWLRFRR